jgi:hypothetical protein
MGKSGFPGARSCQKRGNKRELHHILPMFYTLLFLCFPRFLHISLVAIAGGEILPSARRRIVGNEWSTTASCNRKQHHTSIDTRITLQELPCSVPPKLQARTARPAPSFAASMPGRERDDTPAAALIASHHITLDSLDMLTLALKHASLASTPTPKAKNKLLV